MNWPDYIILLAVATALTGGFLWSRHRRKAGKTCCKDCHNCRKCS